MTNEKDEWGNIELPGLSDEELFKKNWHKVGINKERFSNDDFKKKHRDSIIQALNKEETKIKIKEKQSKFRTEEFDLKHKEIMIELYQTKKWKDRVNAANKNPIRNQKIREAHALGVHTPLGEFLTLGQAGLAHNISSEGIRYRIKTRPNEYYYLKK